MGYWIFMLIMNLLTPAVMIVFGIIFKKRAPKEINWIYGYRTALSMKNEDTWQVAHKRCGELFLRGGIAMSILVVVVMLIVLGKSVSVISNVGAVLVFVPIVAVVVCAILTDKTLKRTFDKDGNRLQK